jgi:CubicO group peptidase (beta-lactamase class C family)
MEFMVRTFVKRWRKFPDAPKDLYSASGYQGQKVFIIPSKDMVIVRLGLTDESQFDINEVLKGI